MTSSRWRRRAARGRAVRVVARLSLAVAAVASAVWWAPPAAASDATISFKCAAGPTPAPGSEGDPRCTPDERQRITGSWSVAFNVKAGAVGRLRRVRLFVISETQGVTSPGQEPNGNVPPVAVWGDPGSQADWSEITASPNAVDLVYTWETPKLTPYNARYKLRIEARTHSDNDSQVARVERVQIGVDNPPTRPAAPVASQVPGGARLDWSASPEPDLLHYEVLRAKTSSPSNVPSSSDFAVVAPRVQGLSFNDRLDDEGTYWYRVRAVRRSVVAEDGHIESLQSASARQSVRIVPTPVPTGTPAVQGTSTGTYTPAPPRPVAVSGGRRPPVPDAPFSAVLPYGDIPGSSEGGVETSEQPPPQAMGSQTVREVRSRGAVVTTAVGAFMFAAALALNRVAV